MPLLDHLSQRSRYPYPYSASVDLGGVGRRRGGAPVSVVIILIQFIGFGMACGPQASTSTLAPPRVGRYDYDYIVNHPSHVENVEEGNGDMSQDEPVTNNNAPVGKGQAKQSGEVSHLCQWRLTAALEKVCQGSFHTPITVQRDPNKSRRRAVRSGVRTRRLPRSLVDECCRKYCPTMNMRKYCKDTSGTNPPPRQSKSNETLRFNGDNSISTEPTDNAVVTEQAEPKRTSKNAITSTLPPLLIPLGRGINDYDYPNDLFSI